VSSEAFVYDAVRTPRGRGKDHGALHGVKPITLVTGRIAKNMMGALFFDTRAVNGGLARPGVDTLAATRIAVLGAGMMGAGIAQACARAGLPVVVKDVTAELAARAAGPGIVTTVLRFAAQHDDFAGRAASLAKLYGERFVQA
jgi:NADPH-dependent 2,4-dienoyl-CoA reductase/sulfur reductase-like enzyme